MRAEISVFIDRPPQEVFAFIADRRNEPQWSSYAKQIDQTSLGPIGAGTRFRGAYRMFGTLDIEVTEYEPSRRLVVRSRTRSVDYRMVYTLSPAAAGTHLQIEGEEQVKGPMKLLAPMMALMRKPIFRSLGGGIKRALEQPPTRT